MDTTTDTEPALSGGFIGGVVVSAVVVFVVMVIIILCCSCNRGLLRSYAYNAGILRHNPRTQQTTVTSDDTTSRITYPDQPRPQDGTCDDTFQYGVGDSENQKYEYSSGPSCDVPAPSYESSGPSCDVPAPSYESIFGPNEVIIPSCPPEEISNRTVPSSYKT